MSNDSGKSHPMERILDNMWLLLVVSFMISFISYFGWAMFDFINMKPAGLQ